MLSVVQAIDERLIAPQYMMRIFAHLARQTKNVYK